MFKIILVTFFVIYNCECQRNCRDCVSVSDCPRGSDYIEVIKRNQKVVDKFKNAVCGFEKGKGPKVCCSDFSDNDGVDDHPNIRLLPDSCGDIDGRRIVGGKVANLYEFPWMALISIMTGVTQKEFNCGGSIINARYILTVAHCVQYQNIAGVRIGEYDTRFKQDCLGEGESFVCESNIQDIRVERKIIHETFDIYEKTNDIALLRLSRPIDFRPKNALSICLPVSSKLRNVPLRGKTATVAGWGLTEKRQYSDVLLKVNVTIHGPCSGQRSRPAEFCAGDYRKDSCTGDTGGPLMLEDMYKGAYKIIQYGIVSRGPSDCGSSDRGIYTDITKHMKWILDNIAR